MTGIFICLLQIYIAHTLHLFDFSWYKVIYTIYFTNLILVVFQLIDRNMGKIMREFFFKWSV